MINVELYDNDRHYLKLLNMKLREADREELLASTGLTQVDGLTTSVEKSNIVCYTYLYNDKLIALSGASQLPGFAPNFAVVWAMGTDEVLEYWSEVEPLFTKHVNAVLDEPGITSIGNVIDLRNKAHIRWIKKLGFTLSGIIIELGGYDFETFYKRKEEI